MAGQSPWLNQSYYGNAAPYAFAYNANNSSEAYRYNNNYNNNYRPSPIATNAPGAYSQPYRNQNQGYYGNVNNNYAPSVSSSMRDGAYGGIDRNLGHLGAASVGGAESLGSRWSMGSAPREKQEDVLTMMDKGQFSLNEVKVARNIKEYRREYREGMWTRGSRPRIFGRFFCFFLMVIIYLIFSGVLGLALYIRPPSATFKPPSADLDGVQFDLQGLVVPLEMNISIWNPTFIKAVVKKIHVDLFYPIGDDDRPIGNGTRNDIWIRSNDRTNFTFPIDIDYSFQSDPNLDILQDIFKKCGDTTEGLSIKAKAMVAANILGIPISSPTVPIKINVGCPIAQDKLKSIVEQVGNFGTLLGVNLPDL